ncbi:MAG: PilZ domain-containing protein [Planctomycetota bacterium]|nr:PilZ domain-containing protein [Planctomycetota bacterium]
MTGSLHTRDRRAAPRTKVTYRMDVIEPEGDLLGCILDLSAAGMRMKCFGNVDLQSTDRLKIRFPMWVGLGPGIEVQGRFVWSKTVPSGYEGGFAFHRRSRKQTALLEELIATLARAAEEDGLIVPGNPDPAEVQTY